MADLADHEEPQPTLSPDPRHHPPHRGTLNHSARRAPRPPHAHPAAIVRSSLNRRPQPRGSDPKHKRCQLSVQRRSNALHNAGPTRGACLSIRANGQSASRSAYRSPTLLTKLCACRRESPRRPCRRCPRAACRCPSRRQTRWRHGSGMGSRRSCSR